VGGKGGGGAGGRNDPPCMHIWIIKENKIKIKKEAQTALCTSNDNQGNKRTFPIVPYTIEYFLTWIQREKYSNMSWQNKKLGRIIELRNRINDPKIIHREISTLQTANPNI
jgi:hypothetical protein